MGIISYVSWYMLIGIAFTAIIELGWRYHEIEKPTGETFNNSDRIIISLLWPLCVLLVIGLLLRKKKKND